MWRAPTSGGGLPTSATMTTGSVLFANSSGQAAQDNANLFWDDTNNFLGIGTAVPAAKLHVHNSTASSYAIAHFTTGSSGALSSDGFDFAFGGAGLDAEIINKEAGRVRLGTSNAYRWDVSSSGHLIAATDNSFDIGATGATRPRNVFTSGYWEGSEIAAPGVAPANGGRLYFVDNGSGKTQLAVIFQSGSAIVLATEV